MDETVVRLTGITIQNFKNVVYGTLVFENHSKDFKSSILGLYGQNGSGKTALINAIELLQNALCGRPIPSKFADFININSKIATLTYRFDIEIAQVSFSVIYETSLKKVEDTITQNTESATNIGVKYRTALFNEVIKTLIFSSNGKNRIGKLIDTNAEEIFLPRPKVSLLVGKKKETKTNLLVAKKLTEASSRSFIFSKELLTAIRDQVREHAGQELILYTTLLEALVKFGNREFVVSPKQKG